MRAALKKQWASLKATSGAWLDLQAKLEISGRLLARALLMRSPKFQRAPYRPAVERYLEPNTQLEAPELTEVALCTLLHREGVGYETASLTQLYADDAKRRAMLDRCPLVFLSSTLLRDLSELLPLARMLKRPDNKVVVGGALVGLLHHRLSSLNAPPFDLVAVGYGELLVPALARWLKSDFRELKAPPDGRLQRGAPPLLFSGVPSSRSLDDLPSPDWSLASAHHKRPFKLVYYESVRGCPYRCAFCNYPFLFDDTKFRFKSAEKIADDWARLAEQGAEYISCLDSLFTMPRRRLLRLCELLIDRKIKVKWICYARADDLDEARCALMKRAGCHMVHVGVESGSQQILDNMNKVCTVEANHRALRAARSAGIITVATVILGFPGETARTVEQTCAFLEASPPDIYYAAAFNVRFEGVPILSDENRARFGLKTAPDGRSAQPYWQHDTMACWEVGPHLRRLNLRMMRGKVALEGSLFVPNMMRYRLEDRDALLAFQYELTSSAAPIWSAGQALDRRLVHPRLQRDAARVLGGLPQPRRRLPVLQSQKT